MRWPTALKTFGAINILFGAGGAFTTFGFAMMVALTFNGPESGPFAEYDTPTAQALMVAACCAGFIVSTAVIVSGFGLLLCRTWGRRLAVACAIYQLAIPLLSIVGFALAMVCAIVGSRAGAPAESAMSSAFGLSMLFVAASATPGGLLTLPYPLALLIVLLLPGAVKACNGDMGNAMRAPNEAAGDVAQGGVSE